MTVAASLAPVALLGLALLGGCARSPTQIVLMVDTDMSQGPAATLTHVRIVVKNPSNTVVWQRLTYPLRQPVDGGASFELPGTLGILARDDGARTIEIDVDAVHDPGGSGTARAPMFTYYAVATFVEEETLVVRVFLADRCRSGALACSPTQTCALERCVPRELPTSTDAGVDAAPDVAPVDVARPDVAPVDVAPVDVAPVNVARPDVAPVDAAPVDAAPVDVARPDVAPVDAAPVDAARPDVAPVDAPRPDPGCPSGQTRCAASCVDLRASAAHCGRCGNACEGGSNASPRCAAGACTLVCEPGRANCDGDARNGCELSVGVSCSVPGNERCVTGVVECVGGAPSCRRVPLACGIRCSGRDVCNGAGACVSSGEARCPADAGVDVRSGGDDDDDDDDD